MRGQLYVDDGNVTTTAAVTSGVQGALHLVDELAGPEEAQRVADLHPELGWTPADSPTIPADHFAAQDWPVGLNNLEPWFRPTVGISLNDGVGELDATAAFEVYAQSAAARPVAVATENSVRTRHGLVLLTTRTQDAPHLSRLVVPGGGFTAALQDLADHTDAATAVATAKMIGYPTRDLDLGAEPPTRAGGAACPHEPPARCRHRLRPSAADPIAPAPPAPRRSLGPDLRVVTVTEAHVVHDRALITRPPAPL